MSTSFLPDTDPARAAVAALFADKPPVLIEVRFPSMGTSPDWYLCEDEAELDRVLDRLGPGVEVQLSSVWDLKNAAAPVVVRR